VIQDLNRWYAVQRPLQFIKFDPLIVFKENDPGEILWDQFSLPELKNFLIILDREEAWYKRRYVILGTVRLISRSLQLKKVY